MIRKAVLFQVKSGCAAEYERRHNPIPDDLKQVLKDHGAHNYSIFLHEQSGQLFAYLEIEDEQRWNKLTDSLVCQRWWGHMTEVLVTDSEDASKGREHELREVFHLD